MFWEKKLFQKKNKKIAFLIFRYPSDKITITRESIKIFARNLANTVKISNNKKSEKGQVVPFFLLKLFKKENEEEHFCPPPPFQIGLNN